MKEAQVWCVDCFSSLLSEVSLQWTHSLSGFSIWHPTSQSVMDYQILETIIRDTNECFVDTVSPSRHIPTSIDSSFQQYESLVKAFDSESRDSLEHWFQSVETYVNSLDEDSKMIGRRVSEV